MLTPEKLQWMKDKQKERRRAAHKKYVTSPAGRKQLSENGKLGGTAFHRTRPGFAQMDKAKLAEARARAAETLRKRRAGITKYTTLSAAAKGDIVIAVKLGYSDRVKGTTKFIIPKDLSSFRIVGVRNVNPLTYESVDGTEMLFAVEEATDIKGNTVILSIFPALPEDVKNARVEFIKT